MIKKYAVFAAVVFVIVKVLETNPGLLSTQQIMPSQIAVNQSQAAYQLAQAAQINDGIRRQREMDDGLGINMVARIVTGQGLTDAEKLASGIFGALVAFALAPLVIVGVIILLIRLTRSTTTEV